MTLRKLVPFAVLALMVVSCKNDSQGSAKKASPSVTVTQEEETPKQEATFEINLRSLGQRVPVIMYHDIIQERTKDSVWFDCTTEEFRKQMELIKERGYQPISIDQFHKHLTTGEKLPDKAILLTFDDNYQGFHDNALPILHEFSYPAVMFVHTGFVGHKEGSHPHMDWPTLKELVKDPLITIGSHTVTHPDLPSLTSSEQEKELGDSKKELEKELGKKIDYLAYPEGKNDAVSQTTARTLGYTMAFSIVNGQAEDSPTIMCINRYIHTRLEKALEDCETETKGGVMGLVETPWKEIDVAYREEEIDGRKLAMVLGGKPFTVTSETRESVLDFMHRTNTVAGINGTFFAMAAIAATDNRLVGPCKTQKDPELIPDRETVLWPKLRNRPLVIMGPTKFAIVPYNPDRLNEDAVYKGFMPDMTDTFLGGVWLVHNGMPREKNDLKVFGSKDIEDPRRRAAFGIMADGTPVAACSKDSVPSSKFSEMLSRAGVQEAVLLDSGFSTSLVYGEKIMASGHSTPTTPSRPVPHAIVFQGTLDPASKSAAEAAIPATTATADGNDHKKRRRHKKKKAAGPDVQITATPTNP